MRKLIVGILALMGLAAYAVAGPTGARNRRNKNPGNIRAVAGQNWLGQIGSDPEYAIFDTMYSGWRAMAITLLNYEHRHGLRTIRQIISRYAPASENDTAGYIAYVANRLHLGADEQMSVRQYLRDLVLAIANREGSAWSLPDEELDRAIVSAKAATV